MAVYVLCSICSNLCCEDISECESSVSFCSNVCSQDIIICVSSCLHGCNENIIGSIYSSFVIVVMSVVNMSLSIYLLCL